MRLNTFIGVFLILLVCACAHGSRGVGKAGGLASGPDIPSLFFKAGQPLGEDGLMHALNDRFTDPDKVLVGVAQMANASKARIEVGGHTDLEECKTVDCYDLSLRRARAVRAWLIKRGVLESALSVPKGYGHDRAIAGDSTDSERAYNRRVEFSLIWTR